MKQMKNSIKRRCNFIFIPMIFLSCAYIFCLFFCINGYTKSLNAYTINYKKTANFSNSFNKYENSMRSYFKYGGDYYLSSFQEKYENSKKSFAEVYSEKTVETEEVKTIINDMDEIYNRIDKMMIIISTDDNNDNTVEERTVNSVESMRQSITTLLEKQSEEAALIYATNRARVVSCIIIMIVATVVFIGFMCFFIYFLRKRITQPVEDIVGWAHLFDEGYSEMDELKYDKDDEIAQIMESFNIVRKNLITANSLKKEYEIAITKLKNEEEYKKKFVKQLYEEKAEKDAISTEAKHDGLTGLFNRRSFDRIVSEFVQKRPGGNEGTLFIIDMDNFKTVNDTLGHLGGDEALKTLAGVLRIVFSGAYIGRYGGDEFIVFKTGFKDENESAELAENLCTKMDRMIEYEGKKAKVSVSVGVADTIGVTDCSELYMKADKALYFAKDHGRNQYALQSQIG